MYSDTKFREGFFFIIREMWRGKAVVNYPPDFFIAIFDLKSPEFFPTPMGTKF
jgi:hypothetical protein